MSHLVIVEHVPSPVRFEEVETTSPPLPCSSMQLACYPNRNLNLSPSTSSSESSSVQSDLILQLSPEAREEMLGNSGLFCVRWMCFAHHYKRVEQDNLKRFVEGTSGMVKVACKEQNVPVVASAAAESPAHWKYFQVEKSIAAVGSLELRNRIEKLPENQPIYIENVSPRTMERILLYMNYGSVYGPLDKLEQFLEAQYNLKVGAVWPNYYAFICVSCGPKTLNKFSKTFHTPWTDDIQIDENVCAESVCETSQSKHVEKVNPAFSGAAEEKERYVYKDKLAFAGLTEAAERTISRVPNRFWQPPLSNITLEPQRQQVVGNMPASNQAIYSSSTLSIYSSTYFSNEKKTANQSSTINTEHKKKSTQTTFAAQERMRTIYFGQRKGFNILTPPRPMSVPPQLSTALIDRRPIKRRYRRIPTFSLPISAERITPDQQNITLGRPIVRKRVEMLAQPPPLQTFDSIAATVLPALQKAKIAGTMHSAQQKFNVSPKIPQPSRKMKTTAKMLPPSQKMRFAKIRPSPPKNVHMAEIMPPPPPPPPLPRPARSRVNPQPYDIFATSLRQADSAHSIVQDYREWSQHFIATPPAPSPVSNAGYYSMTPHSSGSNYGYTPSTPEFPSHTRPQRNMESPQIKTCPWCKLTFGSSLLLRQHQLSIHTSQESLFTFPIGSVAAANRANFESYQAKQFKAKTK